MCYAWLFTHFTAYIKGWILLQLGNADKLAESFEQAKYWRAGLVFQGVLPDQRVRGILTFY